MKNAKRRSLWHFTCKICGSPDHQTLVRKRAKKGVCLKCAKIDPRQLSLINTILEPGNNIPYSSNLSQGLDLQGNKIAGDTHKSINNL